MADLIRIDTAQVLAIADSLESLNNNLQEFTLILEHGLKSDDIIDPVLEFRDIPDVCPFLSSSHQPS